MAAEPPLDLRTAVRELGKNYFAVHRVKRALDVGAGSVPRYRVTRQALDEFMAAEVARRVVERAAGEVARRQ
jgi:hypothetical protein